MLGNVINSWCRFFVSKRQEKPLQKKATWFLWEFELWSWKRNFKHIITLATKKENVHATIEKNRDEK